MSKVWRYGDHVDTDVIRIYMVAITPNFTHFITSSGLVI